MLLLQSLIQGTLHLPQEARAVISDNLVWSNVLSNRILVAIAALLMLLELKDLLRILPSVLDSLTRPSAGISLEHSMTMSRSRNLLAILYSVALCLFVDRFRLYNHIFIDKVPQDYSALLIAAFWVGYLLLRRLMYLLLMRRFLSSDAGRAIHNCIYSAIIVLVLVMVASTLVIIAFKLSDSTARIIYYSELGLAFLLNISQVFQISRTKFSGFSSILYLCALEFVPLAAFGAFSASF